MVELWKNTLVTKRPEPTVSDPHMVDQLYNIRKDKNFDEKAKDDLIYSSCMRCGNCCLRIPCLMAVDRGVEQKIGIRCPYLEGDKPGSFNCLLIEGCQDVDDTDLVSFGDGCGNPTNMDRLTAAENQTKKRKENV